MRHDLNRNFLKPSTHTKNGNSHMTPLSFLSRSRAGALAAAIGALTLITSTADPAFARSSSFEEAEAVEAVMEGRVMDQTGASVSGVKVILIGTTTRQVTSDREGRFKISVPEGSYVLTAEKPGFLSYAAANIEMKAGPSFSQEIRLEVARSEDITVEEQASAVSLDASQNAGAVVLKDGDLEALPDDPDELAAYLQSLAGNSGGPNGGQIYIDGFTGGRVPNKASIREIRLNSNPFSAEFDRMGWGRIEIITRPGTDRYRGGASFRFNNDALNTRNPFGEAIKPHYQREDYSIDFAGPIAKGKASFAFDSDYRTVDGNDTINAVTLDENLLSTPFVQTVVRPTTRLSFSPRIDWQISDKQSLTVRYSHSENKTLDSGIGGYNLPSRGFDSKNSENSGDFTLNSILGRMVNEVRMRFSKSGRDQTALDPSPTLVVQDSFTSGGAAVGLSRNDGTRFELTDVVSWATRKHAFRAGFRVRRNTTDETSRNNFAGVVTFAGGSGPELDANFNPIPGPGGVPNTVTLSSLERYRRTLALQARGLSPAQIRALGGGATQFLVAGGNPVANVSQTDLGVFFNDDWKKTDRLVLGLGLRAELQNNIDTRLELAPRLSFAYSLKLDKDGRTPKTVTRGGIGVFYDRVGEGLVLDANRYLGGGRLQYLVTDTAVLDQIRVSNGGVTSVPTVDTLNRFSQPQNTRVLDTDVRAPRSIQGSLSLEQQLGKMFTGSLTLIASRGDNQLRSRNINAIRADGTRPLAVPGAVYAYETTGRNQQFQVVTGLATRPGQRNSFFVRYFLGWAEGDTDGAGTFPADPNDIGADWGRASSDVRHRVMAGGNIRGPWNISIGPMITISTGRPYNITTGRDLNFDTVFSDRPSFGVAGQPGVIETEYGALDTTGSGVIIPRNYGEGPGFASVSLRISKTIPFKKAQAATPQGGGPGMGGGGPMGGGPMGGGHGPGGGMGRGGGPGGGPGLTISLSVSNLLDRVNPSTPVGNLTSPQFGQSTSLAGFFMGFGGGGGGGEAGNRRIELQARLTF